MRKMKGPVMKTEANGIHCRPERTLGSDQHGYTLIEILIALSIFSIGMLAVASMQIKSIQTNDFANNVTESTTWAQDKFEDLITRAWTDTAIAAGTQSETNSDGYTITWTVIDEDLDSNLATAELKRITVRASWRDNRGNNKISQIAGAYPAMAAP
jgi:prepilin-type N-terminal cleavage/methylation domain-containing protein